MSETPERPVNSELPAQLPSVDDTTAGPAADASAPGSPEAPTGLPPAPGLPMPTGLQAPADTPAPAGTPAPNGMSAPQLPQMQPPAQLQQAGAPAQPVFQQPGAPQEGAPQLLVPPPGHQAPAYPGAPGLAGAPTKKKGLSTGAIIGIVGGGVLLLLVILAIIIFSIVRGSGGSASGSSGSSDPAAVVEEYLTALAENDADTARKLTGGTTSDKLLTQEVLEYSNEVAPITNIVVDAEGVIDGEYDEAVVSASYQIGDETVSRDFTVWQFSDHAEISDGIMHVSLGQFEGLDPALNGVAVGPDSLAIFPVAYDVTLENENFAVTGAEQPIVITSNEDTNGFYELQPTLTDEATAEFRELVRASLTECLASTSLNTPCGMDVSAPFNGGEVAIDGTVVRTLSAEGDAALNALEPRSDYDNPLVVTSSDYIQVSITVDAEKDGMRGTGDVLFGADLLSPTVDFSADSPQVVWR